MIKVAVLGEVKNEKPDINKKYFDHLKTSNTECNEIYPSPPEEAVKNNDCLVVCGGGDIHPRLYKDKVRYKGKYDIDFDNYESNMIKEFIKYEKPVLGICRGMQAINVALGGTLIQDIPEMLGLYHQNYGGKECTHEIKISKKSNLSKILGIRAIVNSYHHQSVHKLGKNLIVTAAAHDGVIEAIEGTEFPILGVQWHPERMLGNDLFDYFFSLIQK